MTARKGNRTSEPSTGSGRYRKNYAIDADAVHKAIHEAVTKIREKQRKERISREFGVRCGAWRRLSTLGKFERMNAACRI